MKRILAAAFVGFFALTAQAAEPEAPGAGTLLQQVQPITPPSPLPNETGLTIEQEGGGKLPPSAPFLVKTLQISGNTLFDTPTLHALVADGEGKTLTLSQVGELAARITNYYHSHGYPLARAIIPAQAIQEGVVVIQVIEARFGKVRLDNHSRVNDPLVEATLSPLQSGQAIDQRELDHCLLLLNDIPGIVVNATLKPGETVGTSDLVVQASPGPALTGNIEMDDYGNRYTGRVRFGATINFIDPLHHGDVLSVNALSSGREMDYGRVVYESLVNGEGTRMGGSYSDLHYILGDTFSSLNGHGTAQVESLWAKHPFVRSVEANLYGQVQYDRLELHDDINATGIRTDRHLDNLTATLAGDARDALLSGAVNAWNLGLTAGHVSFSNSEAQLADAKTANTQDRFVKGNVNLSRLQSMGPKNALYLAFTGQWANTNLDPSQKMIAGGPYSVRAYDMSALSGDVGYLGTAELRHDLGSAWEGQWQAVAFIDSQHVTVNKAPWTATVNSANLGGAGLGLNWTGRDHWSAKAYVATQIGALPALVASNASVHAWVEINKGF
jgi:hemolysin activation/secretion protein